MKIVVLDGYAGNPGDLSWDKLSELGDCTIYDRTSPEELISRCQNADIILTNKVQFNADTLNQLPQLKLISVLATGYNIIDIDAAKQNGILVSNVPAYSTHSVAQMVFAHILNITNQVYHYAVDIKKGRWSNSKDFCFIDTPLVELHDKKMGIIGLGNTGMATARIAIGFGMKVSAFTSKSDLQLVPEIKKSSLDEIFSTCDIISLHCPLTASTKGLVNAQRLAMMKPSSILINTSRGPIINAQDLAEALNEGRIAAAGIDVLDQEPPKADNPLLSAKNCYITPHIAWASFEARERLMQITVNNVKAFLENSPINVVNK